VPGNWVGNSVDLAAKKKIFAEKVLSWFQKQGRRLPWRRTRDPYKVLVAEIMLQKTKAQQVEKVFPSFLKKYPDLPSLAKAKKPELRALMKPLGLSYRAERLLSIAREIEKKFGGEIPKTPSQLAELKGVGKYIGNAVACFAFGEPLLAVDRNVERVVKRVFGRSGDVHSFLRTVAPRGKYKEFNRSLIDLGGWPA
jgi:A/G-specific adenine glycosylase